MDENMNLIGAVDQGTSSTRFLVFDATTAELLSYHQVEIQQICPKEGWMEEDPMEILQSVHSCIEQTINNLKQMQIPVTSIKGIGITNQRETTIVWDKNTGKPLHNAIVWCDNRTQSTVKKLIEKCPGNNQDYLKNQCGLPISTYFSAVKLRWLLDNEPKVKKAVEEERAYFGTVDTWLIWNLTGGAQGGGKHVTDVTNASRTMLFDINTQSWDASLLKFFGIPKSVLPEIRSSAEHYGSMTRGSLTGVSLCGCLGDQQAALVGQTCFTTGAAKNTYGTGCFLLQNIGRRPVVSKNGLLTTIAYKLGKDEPTYYALEGSIAVAGGLVKWLRDNLGIIKESKDIETLASTVENAGDVVFVPAFSGLYAPYWRSDARGTLCGITQWTTKAHIAYAALEAVCYQTREIIEAMHQDSLDSQHGSTEEARLRTLQVDGGMTNNNLLMQLQANILGCTVLKPSMPETTALGAAMAAGKACGAWSLDPKDLTSVTFERYEPNVSQKDIRYSKWKLAVEKSMGWHYPEDLKGANLGNNEDGLSLYQRSAPGALYLLSSLMLIILSRM